MRNQGWESAIEKYIQEISEKEFGWGSCDCLLFVSDAAKIICGKDPMSKSQPDDPETIRGAYTSEKEAYVLIKKHRSSMEAIMDVMFERVDPVFSQRGDIVLQDLEGNMTFGLVWARGTSFFKTLEKGMVALKAKDAAIAWKVE